MPVLDAFEGTIHEHGVGPRPVGSFDEGVGVVGEGGDALKGQRALEEECVIVFVVVVGIAVVVAVGRGYHVGWGT